MSKTNVAAFAQNPRMGFAVVTAAIGSINTATPTNLYPIITAGPEGGLLSNASVVTRGTTTAASLLLYVSTDAGVTKNPVDSALLAPYTNSTTLKRLRVEFTEIAEDTPMRVPANAIVYGGSEVAVADGLVFKVELTDF